MELAIKLASFIRPFPRVPLLGWGGGVWVGWGVSGLLLSRAGWLVRVPFSFCVLVRGARENVLVLTKMYVFSETTCVCFVSLAKIFDIYRKIDLEKLI